MLDVLEAQKRRPAMKKIVTIQAAHPALPQPADAADGADEKQHSPLLNLAERVEGSI
jgi:hypothetical protein